MTTDRLLSIAIIAMLCLVLIGTSLLLCINYRIRQMDAIIRQGECKQDSLLQAMDTWLSWQEFSYKTRTGYVPEEVKRHVDSAYNYRDRIKEQSQRDNAQLDSLFAEVTNER